MNIKLSDVSEFSLKEGLKNYKDIALKKNNPSFARLMTNPNYILINSLTIKDEWFTDRKNRFVKVQYKNILIVIHLIGLTQAKIDEKFQILNSRGMYCYPVTEKEVVKQCVKIRHKKIKGVI